MNNVELDIVKSFQAGDKESFVKLYDKYLKQIYGFIYYKTSHKETAEDLTSQTFFKALRYLGGFNFVKNSSFSAWLFTIARNCVIDHYRSSKLFKNIDDVWDLASTEDIAKNFESKEESAQLLKYLKELNSKQREIVILRVFQDLSYREIANITNRSESACKMDFSRALKKLKEKIPLETLVLILLLTKIN